MKQYSQRLEGALTALKKKRDELQRDCDTLNREYGKEVRKAERRRELLTQIRSLVSIMLTQNKMCDKCRGSSEISQIQKILKERIMEQEQATSVVMQDMSFNSSQ